MARRRNRSDDFDPIVNSAMSAYRRLDPKSQRIVLIVVLVAGLIAAGVYFYQQRHAPGPQTQGPSTTTTTPTTGVAGAPASVQMLLGNPSGATTDPSNRANYLMLKPYYALSYNDAKGTPNWVSWRVTQADLGTAPRKQIFDSDNALPQGFKIVTHKYYGGSGFDRGHMCPHSDRAATRAMSYATFVMTNIIPQAPNVNQKAWAQLEDYCRDLVRREHDRLYVISGPAGEGGRGKDGAAQTIAGGKVTVPAECWKIIVIVPDTGSADDDLSRIGPSTRVIAVDMPNDNEAVGEAWAPFRTTVGQIEGKTGYHFFDRLPAEVAQALRQKADTATIAPPKPMNYDRD
jgi:endonuclease G